MSIDVYQTTPLILALDKPSQLRNSDDLDVVYNCLKTIKAYSGLHPYLLQQMCLEVRYERLKERIVVYQGGKPEKNCYVVMSGSLIVVDIDQLSDILNHNTQLIQNKQFTLVTEGCAFGNNFRIDSSVNNRNPFSINLSDSKAVVTQDICELLYMDQKVFQEIWSKNEKFFRDLNMSRDISALENNMSLSVIQESNQSSNITDDVDSTNTSKLSKSVRVTNPGKNLTVIQAAHFLYKSSKPLLTSLPSQLLSQIKLQPGLNTKSSSIQVMLGEDMVSWMRQIIKINSRLLAIGIWQILLEDHILQSLTCPYILKDSSNDFYMFNEQYLHSPSTSVGFIHPNVNSTTKSPSHATSSFDDLDSAINYLMKLAPDALFRMVLHKPSKERTKDELEFIYGEMLHIKALSHLSSMVKRQLAMVLMYEIHPQSGKVLFYQGSEGTSWYIILKGSVDVHIKGKGVVCKLKSNDDFGKLALVNNSPRAATIILKENDCHFLKIDKEDFNRILRNVEVNTVRLKEHGRDVLLFEKRQIDPNIRSNKAPLINLNSGSNVPLIAHNSASSNESLYSIMAGTPEKLIDHILDNCIDINKSYASILDRISSMPDPILETFILTYFCFLSSHGVCSLLLVYFQSYSDNIVQDGRATPIEDKEHDRLVMIKKMRVVHFLYWWCRISDGAFFDDRAIQNFAENLLNLLGNDKKFRQLMNREFLALSCLLDQFQKTEILANKKVGQRSKLSKHYTNSTNNNNNNTANLVSHNSSNINNSNVNSNFSNSDNIQTNTNSMNANVCKISSLNQPSISLHATSNVNNNNNNNSSSPSSSQNYSNQLFDISPIKSKDIAKFTVYFSSGTSVMLRLPVETRVEQIIMALSKHQNSSASNFCLCEIVCDNEKLVLDMDDVGVMYSSYISSRLYLLSYDEQKDFQIASSGGSNVLSSGLTTTLSPKKDCNTIFDCTTIDELAFHLTFVDWQLFKNIHVYELLVKVIGRSKLGKITANLDSFIYQFTSVQYWTVTEICQCTNLNKRVTVVKKLIKLAGRLSELKNISSSFAVLMGLNNSSVVRLQNTWERLANKHKKLFQELCSMLDPTRNHCAFRQYLKKTSAPIIPFLAIMMKDLTFINEANKTFFDDYMINFEKMQLFASTMHMFLHCRTRPMIFENSTSTKKDRSTNQIDVQFYVRNLKCITDQKQLTQLSCNLEAKTNISSNITTSANVSSSSSAAAALSSTSHSNVGITASINTQNPSNNLTVGFNSDNNY